jgi:hypothetical protein
MKWNDVLLVDPLVMTDYWVLINALKKWKKTLRQGH